MSGRVSWSESGKKIECRIETPREPLWIVAWPLAALPWGAGLVELVNGTGDLGGETPAFRLTFAAFWLLFGLALTLKWLHTLSGAQVISIFRHRLEIRDEILGLGWGQSYEVRRIRNLGTRPPFGPPSPRILLGYSGWDKDDAAKFSSSGTVGFEYNGKRRAFGIQLTEEEAQAVVEKLKLHLPESASS